MSSKIRKYSRPSILGALVLSLGISSAWAGDAVAQDEAGRALRRAQNLVQQGQYKQACAEFERASELAGGACPDCLLGVARAYSGAGQFDSAIQVTRMALSMLTSTERQAQAYDQLGSLLALKGDLNAAREAFGKAVQLDGRMAGQVRTSLADALLKRASYAEAAHRAGTDPESPEVQTQAP